MAVVSACGSSEHDDYPAPDRDPGKWADEQLRDIHNLKHLRQTRALLTYLDHDDPYYRSEAVMAFGSVQDIGALEALAGASRDAEPEVRMMAAFALGQLFHADASPALVQLIQADTTTVVRTEALEALGKTGSPEAAQFLLDYQPRFLFDEAGMAWGMYHLALRGATNDDHARWMASVLASDFEDSRLAAASYFSRFAATETWGGLERLLNVAVTDPSAEVRMAAALALGKHELPDRREVLEALTVHDRHPGVRVHAIRSLAQIGQGEETVAESLFDGNPNVAHEAARFFVEHPDLLPIQRARQQSVAHPEPSVRSALLAALLRAGEEPDELLRRLKVSDAPEKLHLMHALRWWQGAHAVLDSLLHEPDVVWASRALNVQLNRWKDKSPGCESVQHVADKVWQRADPGMMAMLAQHLAEQQDLLLCLKNFDALPLMNAMTLPEDLEAWLALNDLRVLQGHRAMPQPELSYAPIRWEELAASGAHPELDIHTTRGTIRVVLLDQDAPATVSNILRWVDEGFYNGKAFHRVVPNFVVQTGCPRGDGFGSGNELLRTELSPIHYGPGVVGMASAGKDTESTQWFITHRTTPHLDGRYSIIGAVVSGMDVVWELCEGDVIERIEPVN